MCFTYFHLPQAYTVCGMLFQLSSMVLVVFFLIKKDGGGFFVIDLSMLCDVPQ